MQATTASKTALGTAYMRAAHQLFDRAPLLFDDPAALSILGKNAAAVIRTHKAQHRNPVWRALRSHVCLRARFAEEGLAEAAARGTRRYVLVGAGFDTFAWRRPDWAKSLAVIEIDHPATQAVKREMIAAAGLKAPDNHTFVPVDFTRETLGDALARFAIARDESVYFSWLGVCMYLKEEAIDATLQAMAAFAAGSGVTLTFKQHPAPEDRDHAALSDFVANLGEAFVSYFSPETMADKLTRHGFAAIDFLTPEKAAARYYTPPRRNLPPPTQTNIVRAVK
jgi:methyltransferase (TIGR00027 family)